MSRPNDQSVIFEEESREQVNRVNVKTPPFWTEKPELWLALLEGQFTLGGIVQDSTKYAYVLSQLDTKNAREVKDVIAHPPDCNKYATLKNALISRLSESQEQRTRQLLEHEELGDRKPSQFLRHLQTLAGANVPDQILRTLWLGRLPSQLQAILAPRSRDKLEDVAKQADRIYEVTAKGVAEVTGSQRHHDTMEEQIRQLTQQVAELSKRLDRSRPKSHSGKKGCDRSKSRSKQNGLCLPRQIWR